MFSLIPWCVVISTWPQETQMDGTRIESWEQFQRRFASSLSRIQDDRLLGLAAAANPLYALEELGFTIPRDVEASIAEHLRFKPQTLARIRQLRDEVHRHAGRAFDISSPDELERVLFDQLKIVRPSGGDGSAGTYHAKAGGRFASPLPQQVGAGESPADPLETLRGAASHRAAAARVSAARGPRTSTRLPRRLRSASARAARTSCGKSAAANEEAARMIARRSVRA